MTEPRFLAECEAFRERVQHAAHDHVYCELHARAVADLAQEEGLTAENVERGLDFRKQRLGRQKRVASRGSDLQQ